MDHEEVIIERLERLENKITPMADTARAVGELREELAPRVNEAVHALIRELAEVEADFQLEDLLYFIKKVLRNLKNLNFTLDQLKNLIDFALTIEPLLKSAIPQIIFYLDGLEQKGVFRLLSTAIEVIEKIGSRCSSEELQQIGEGLVRLVDIAKTLTTPEALDFLEKAAEVPRKVDLARATPTGPLGLLWSMRSNESKEGLGVVVELTKGLAVLKRAPS